MKKHFFWRFSLILSLLFAGYWGVSYANLKNPMSEIMYSETSGLNIINSKSFVQVIGDFGGLKSDEQFKTFRYSEKFIDNDEELRVMIFKKSGLSFFYDTELEDGVHLRMTFAYYLKNDSLTQDVIYLYKNNTEYENQALIDELSAYGKDLNWLQNQSRKVVEDYILGTWFEHGSDRYSLDNLGNLTIEYHELVTEE